MSKIKICLALYILLTMFLSGPVHKTYADPPQPSASYSISGGTLTSGATFPVTVYENSGAESINIMSLKLDYDATQLQYLGVDPGVGLTDVLPSSASGNIVSIVRIPSSSPFKISGLVKTAVVNFKALGSAGSTILKIDNGSQIYSSSTNKNIWDGLNSDTSFSFATLPPDVSNPQPPAPATTVQALPVTSTSKPYASSTNYKITPPLDSVLGSSDKNLKLHGPYLVEPPNNAPWILLIYGCLVIATGLGARLLNVRQKIPVAVVDKMLVSSLAEGLTSKNYRRKKIPVTALDKMLVSSVAEGLTSKNLKHKLKAAK